MKRGSWLAINLGSEDAGKYLRFFSQRQLPLEVLNPLTLYSEDCLKRIIRPSDGFAKNDTQFMSQIRQLEGILIAKNVNYESGVAKLVDKDFDIEKALSIFGVSKDNEKRL